MNSYEILLDEARNIGLVVKEKPLQSGDGRIKGNKIAIRHDIKTSRQKANVLAEELGHYYTSTGDIRDQSTLENRKQERQARLHGYNRLIGLVGIIHAFNAGCQNKYEIADFLDVTEEYLEEWDSPEVEYLDDGSVWVYYRDQKIDITDKFNEDGICYVQVKDEKGPIYMTIKYQNGWGSNRKKYMDPKKMWG